MEDGGLTIFDWVVISVVGLSGLLALFRGFIREVLSLMTWLIAAFITINFYDDVKEFLAPHVSQKMLLLGFSTVGLFVVVLIILSIINTVVMKFLQSGSDISILDSALGMVFGVVRGLFILSLAYVMFAVVMPRDEFPDMVKNARTLPVVEASAGFLQQLAPGYTKQLEEASEQAAKEGERMAREKAEEELKQMKEDGGDPAKYDADQRQELERLLRSLQREGDAPDNDAQTIKLTP
ncbi:MAG: CvpA family protein [Alphaproteobacteria bacterium]|nr:CvpA family protein [Alphaproteobacteria bacterium]